MVAVTPLAADAIGTLKNIRPNESRRDPRSRGGELRGPQAPNYTVELDRQQRLGKGAAGAGRVEHANRRSGTGTW